jgi:hypothetical protein
MFLNVNDAWTLIAQYFSNEVLTNLEVIVESRRNSLGYARTDPKSLSLEHVIQCRKNSAPDDFYTTGYNTTETFRQWAKRMTAPKSFSAGITSSLMNNFHEYMRGGLHHFPINVSHEIGERLIEFGNKREGSVIRYNQYQEQTKGYHSGHKRDRSRSRSDQRDKRRYDRRSPDSSHHPSD